MFKLRLNARQCISCGICMDVCYPRAIDMRLSMPEPVEGRVLTYVHLSDDEDSPVPMMTFPFMALPSACDGCGECVRECPVNALELTENNGFAHGLLEMNSTIR